jgi:OmpA-OmpF porin, OOP family
MPVTRALTVLVRPKENRKHVPMNLILKSVIATAVLTASSVAMAAEPANSGFYTGIDLGRSMIDVSKGNLDKSLASALNSTGYSWSGTSSLDKNGTSFDFSVGYRLMPNLAVEVSYLDLGKANYSASGIIGGTSVNVGVDVSSKGPAAALVGILPLSGGWSLEGRAGVYRGKAKAEGVATVGGSAVGNLSYSTDLTSFMAGAGVAYAFSPNWSAHLNFLYVEKAGDSRQGGNSSVNAVSIGARYAF